MHNDAVTNDIRIWVLSGEQYHITANSQWYRGFLIKSGSSYISNKDRDLPCTGK